MDVWALSHKVAEFKSKLQHDLGVALSDDKIALMMNKTKKP